MNFDAAMGGSKVRLFAASLAAGALLGIATSFLFPMVIAAPILGFAISVAGLRETPIGLSRSLGGAGLLLGAGCVYMYGAVNTLVSCDGSTVCGGTSALPFLAGQS